MLDFGGLHILLMKDFLHQLRFGSLSHYLHVFQLVHDFFHQQYIYVRFEWVVLFFGGLTI